MKTGSIFVTLCLGLAAASAMKRQVATPPPPTGPPMAATTDMAAVDNSTDVNTPPPPVTTDMPTDAPGTDSTDMVTTAAPGPDTTMDDSTTEAATTSAPTTEAPTTEAPTTQAMTTQGVTDEPTTMNPPTPSKIVEVDEIVLTFEEVAESDFYRRLPYDDQILLLEILAGSETGKMTPILEQIGFEDFITFLYNIPLKYQDGFRGLLETGFAREKLLKGMA